MMLRERPETLGTGHLVPAPDFIVPHPSSYPWSPLPLGFPDGLWVCRARCSRELHTSPRLQSSSFCAGRTLKPSSFYRICKFRLSKSYILSWPKPRPPRPSPGLLQAHVDNPEPLSWRNRDVSRGGQGYSASCQEHSTSRFARFFNWGCVRTCVCVHPRVAVSVLTLWKPGMLAVSTSLPQGGF